MVYNEFIKCQVCNTITRVRLQVGLLKTHPIVITCGCCGISLKGDVEIGQDEPSLHFTFENADIMTDTDSSINYDYYVECSGEFPTSKLKEDKRPHVNPFIEGNPISPFIRFCTIGDYKAFRDLIDKLNTTVSIWPTKRRVFELYFASKYELLSNELSKGFCNRDNTYDMNNINSLVEGVNKLKKELFTDALLPSISNCPFRYDLYCIKDRDKIRNVISYLNSHRGYEIESMRKDVFNVLDEFIQVWKYLIPAFSLGFLFDIDSFDYDVDGTTTSTFELIDKFYSDVYETLGNMMIVPVALDNVLYRSDYDDGLLKSGKKYTLDDFISMDKGKRFNSICRDGKFMSLADINVDPQVRNAINHNDYKYDSISQIVLYYPDYKNRTKARQKFLLQIEQEIIGLIKSILVISEYLFYLKKAELEYNDESAIHSFTKYELSYGRNEKCPCGSGIKYKYCHGRRI